MTLTPLYTHWLALLANQERTALSLTGAVVLVILAVALDRGKHRWLLPLAAVGFWAGAVVLAVGMHWAGLRPPTFGLMLNEPLWYDETFTWAVARLDFPHMMQAIAGDVHPPAWYIVEWVTIRVLGDSEVALRYPALLFGILAVYLTYTLARHVGLPDKFALAAAALLAVLPGQLYYSQEARMYTLLEVAVLIAALGVVTNRAHLVAAGVAIALYTHNLAVVYVLPLAVLWFIKLTYMSIDREIRLFAQLTDEQQEAILEEMRRIKTDGMHWWEQLSSFLFILWPFILALLAWLPWLIVLVRQVGHVAGGFWVPDHSLGGYILGPARVVFGVGQPEFMQAPMVVLLWGVLALCIWVVLRTRNKVFSEKPGFSLGMLLSLVLAPVVTLALLSEVWRPIFLERALLPVLPFLAVLLTLALHRLTVPRRLAVLAVLVPMLALGLLFPSKYNGDADVSMAADQVAKHYQQGDVIYNVNLASYITLTYYLREPDYRHACWPDAGDLSQALSLPTQTALGIHRVAAADVDADRLLVVWVENPMTTVEECAALDAALETGQARLVERADLTGNDLARLYVWAVRRGVDKDLQDCTKGACDEQG